MVCRLISLINVYEIYCFFLNKKRKKNLIQKMLFIEINEQIHE